jgi:hypothetical protein
MAQHSGTTRKAVHPTGATGLRSWSRERRIYLAVGILAFIAGVLIIALSR